MSLSEEIKKDVGELGADEAEIRAVMEKYDRESNTRLWEGIPRRIVRVLFVLFSLYAVFLLFYTGETRLERASFVGAIVFLVFVNFPAAKGKKKKSNSVPWYDIVLALLGAGAYFYFALNYQAMIEKAIAISTFDVIAGAVGILVTLEACRRAVGLPIVIVASAFIIYSVAQRAVFSSLPKAIVRNVYDIFYTTEGVIGTPTRACLNFIVLFVIFGAFLERTGISQFFIDVANSIAGASSGGPAKVAVISSALCGMVSGSSVANTVTTGSITIPLMKKTGYRPEFAGAVEAAASTGGQIMPPIMGAAAFLMVEYVSMPNVSVTYGYIALRAILPAALYFLGIFIMVHLEAKKLGLRGVPKAELPNFFKLVLRGGYLLLPLIALIYFLITRTMAFAALAATAIAVAVSMFRKNTRIINIERAAGGRPRLNVTKFFDALENGARSTLTVGIACAVAGIIACVITTTGIGSKLITLIVGVAGSRLLIALVLTMITCIILGMGVPTTANYVIMATTCAPILIKMGVPSIAAHMFVFYFGIVADITPPVALAAYAGSAIAGSHPMKTGINATKLAIAAFIIPYIIAMSPAMVFVDTTAWQVILLIVTSFVGMFGVSMALEGYMHGPIAWPLRILAALGGLCLIDPKPMTDVIGLVVTAAVCAVQILFVKRRNAAAP
ncbi:MAG: TRAP transporter permease [Oscillospiraceae bacterium]|nr:TRAP transporter permease [Oscillospiraceae bacterium]